MTDIRTILSRAASILILSSVFAGLHLWLHAILEPHLGISGATVISFGIMGVFIFATPLWRTLRDLMDRLIIRDTAEYRRRLSSAGHELVTIPDYEGLLQYIVDLVKNIVGVEKAWLVVRDRDGALRVQGAGRDEGIVEQVKDQAKRISDHVRTTGLTFLRRSGMRFITDRDDAEVSRSMAEAGLEIAVPLLYKSDTLGILALGPKKAMGLFRQGDIDALESFAQTVAVAIENAKRYGEAMNDRLTRLYHRKYFLMKVRELADIAVRYRLPLSLLILGVDRFRDVNEQYGHVIGDAVLRDIAGELRRVCRETDVISRYGGDEFAVLLTEAKGEDGRRVAERIRQRIERLRPEGLDVTVSIGSASLSFDDGDTAEEALIQRGWKALAEAKQQGGNRVV